MNKESFLYKVLIAGQVLPPLTYISDTCLSIGTWVHVTLKGRLFAGVVWEEEKDNALPLEKIKPLEKISEIPPLLEKHLSFIEKSAEYNMMPLGMALKLVISNKNFLSPPKRIEKKPQGLQSPNPNHAPISLSDEQQKALDAFFEKDQGIFLIDGVTGSGKTEVYFEKIAEVIRQEKQVLVLLPEISLTSQWLQRFERRFGVKPAIWHSSLSDASRRKTWKRIARNEISCLVGTRSSLFLPFPNLGLIVVDEEHESSFKQEENNIYQGRDMAVLRSYIEKIPLLLASATPSLETLENCRLGKYTRLRIEERYANAKLPNLELIDRRGEPRPFDPCLSPRLRQEIKENLEKNHQTLLFLNRRGYAPVMLCQRCGYKACCMSCSTNLVLHKKSNQLHCHYCDYHQHIPKNCPSCGEEKIMPFGIGAEKVLESVQTLFPDARVLLMTSDWQNHLEKMEAAIRDIENEKVDIIIGTQMMAKGYHFPKLTLVGVIDADMSLSTIDFRAGERTYQMLQQVSGRAGREDLEGRVILQTFQPHHPVLKAIVSGDRKAFEEAERYQREIAHSPPFSRWAIITLSGLDEDTVITSARHLSVKYHQLQKNWPLQLIGPSPALIPKLRGRHQWQFLIKGPKNLRIAPYIKEWLSITKVPGTVRLSVNIDP